MDKSLIAYHGDSDLKAALLREVARHRESDMLVKGTYGDNNEVEFRACAVGCSIHSLAKIQKRTLDTSDHSVLAYELAVPVQLFHIQDAFFEALPEELSQTWPERFLDAIQPGSDTSMVIPQFFYWILADPEAGVVNCCEGYERQRNAILKMSELFKRLIDMVPVSDAEWNEASAEAARATPRSA